MYVVRKNLEREEKKKKMEKEREGKAYRYSAHILAIPYPAQGHINPILQFCKRLSLNGAKTTLVLTKFIKKSVDPKCTAVAIDTISDGYDDGGFSQAKDVDEYLARMELAGSKSLEDLLESYEKSNGHPIDCIVYDAFFPWALRVARKHGVKGAAFFSQACSVNCVYYSVHHGLLKLPVEAPVELPGLPPLDLPDLPSFISVHGSYPAYFRMMLDQYSNLGEADFVLVNSFHKLEEKVVDSMAKLCPFLTIGPTIPSFYLDNRIENDNKYDISLFPSEPSTSTNIINWLDKKAVGSVVYVAFGSMADLPKSQMAEIAWGLKNSDFDILWSVRASDKVGKVPKECIEAMGDKALLVDWSPQLEVLSNKAVGCFVTHCGWNSTTEALSLGVPMVVMPLWTDQTMNAKLLRDVWGVGVRVKQVEEDGVVSREEMEDCIREVMEREKGKEMKMNASKWRDLAKEAVGEGGSSDVNIRTFISKLMIPSPLH